MYMKHILLILLIGMLVQMLRSKRRFIYIFAYGSLMWDHIPFKHASRPATLKHFVRKLCIWSFSGRGTPESPGLYYGLVPQYNKRCSGKLLIFEDECVLQWLDKREGNMYLRQKVYVDGVYAFTYVANDKHPQYDPHISENQIKNAMKSEGRFGSTLEYINNTINCVNNLSLL